MRFKWWKFGTYLGIGLLLFGTWGFLNYVNYKKAEMTIQETVSVNKRLITETINDIEMEQHTLKNIQMVMPQPAPLAGSGAMSMEAAPSPAPVDPMYAELQARIDALEAEKEELKKEKGIIKKAIEDSISVFSGIKVENPLVNAIIIPIFLYLIKKLLDFAFVRLEEWFEEKHGEQA